MEFFYVRCNTVKGSSDELLWMASYIFFAFVNRLLLTQGKW